ncbi:MAG: DUF6178 family protein [Pseudomonadota bacterium]
MKQPGSTEEALQIIISFDTLSPDKQVEAFAKLSAEAREGLIEVSASPGPIMRRVSEEEMLVTIKELGLENAPALIALSTGRQLRYMLDVDLWKNNMFNAKSALRWLAAIVNAGEEKIVQLAQVADRELLLTALSYFVKVRLRDPDIDLLEQQDSLPLFTLDDTFYVEFRHPDVEGYVRPLLETLFHWDVNFYFRLMEDVVYSVRTDNEEMALKWRRARMAEHGLPDFEEALGIYQYLRRGALEQGLLSGRRVDDDDVGSERRLLRYPLKVISVDSVFRRSLDAIADQVELDRLVTELAHLANKVLMADSMDPGSSDDLRSSLKKVGGYINIALEESCGDDAATAAGLLMSNHAELLFRRGFSLILDLRKEAHGFIRGYEGGIENLGHPLAALVEGLLRTRPVYACNAMGEKGERDFEHIEDIAGIRKLMDRNAFEDRWEAV